MKGSYPYFWFDFTMASHCLLGICQQNVVVVPSACDPRSSLLRHELVFAPASSHQYHNLLNPKPQHTLADEVHVEEERRAWFSPQSNPQQRPPFQIGSSSFLFVGPRSMPRSLPFLALTRSHSLHALDLSLYEP